MYRIVAPAAVLRDYIDRYWMVSPGGAEPVRLTVNAFVDLRADLVFTFGAGYRRHTPGRPAALLSVSNLDAQRSAPLRIEQQGLVHLVGVRFQVGGLAAFTGLPMHELSDRTVEVRQVFRRRVRELEGRLYDATPDVRAQGRLLDAFFCESLAASPSYRLFGRLLRGLRDPPDGGALQRVAGRFGCSQRELERLFGRYLGFPPKLFLRVSRFQRALGTLVGRPSGDLSDIALDCGYYDQSHLNRDFRAFAGGSPAPSRGYLLGRAADFAPNFVDFFQDAGR